MKPNELKIGDKILFKNKRSVAYATLIKIKKSWIKPWAPRELHFRIAINKVGTLWVFNEDELVYNTDLFNNKIRPKISTTTTYSDLGRPRKKEYSIDPSFIRQKKN